MHLKGGLDGLIQSFSKCYPSRHTEILDATRVSHVYSGERIQEQYRSQIFTSASTTTSQYLHCIQNLVMRVQNQTKWTWKRNSVRVGKTFYESYLERINSAWTPTALKKGLHSFPLQDLPPQTLKPMLSVLSKMPTSLHKDDHSLTMHTQFIILSNLGSIWENETQQTQ